ncbi:hypothetical protein [Niallia taxi]|uniref:hypothetical protein n=1 Tax=Niallia taxi TaxID=2499688 RepID=UPI0030085577
MSGNYIDFEVVKKMISDQEMTKRRNSIKHNKKPLHLSRVGLSYLAAKQNIKNLMRLDGIHAKRYINQCTRST